MNELTEHCTKLLKAVHASAFEHPDNLIHLFEGGSALHGARTPGKSDLDVYGVFIEPKVAIYGLNKYEHFVTSTSDNDQRNTPDDVDITLYSMRRWAQLAAKGNPTALAFLFAKNFIGTTEWFNFDYRAVLAKSSAAHFMGFVNNQMARLHGMRGQGKHGQRPELGLVHGYDTKAAMHAVRLLGEGTELMQSHWIKFPRPNVDLLLDIRNGKYTLDEVQQIVDDLKVHLDSATAASDLPQRPDIHRVSESLVEVYEEFYQEVR